MRLPYITAPLTLAVASSLSAFIACSGNDLQRASGGGSGAFQSPSGAPARTGVSSHGGVATAPADGGSAEQSAPIISDPFTPLAKGTTQLTALCKRKLGDAVSQAFCGATPPNIKSIGDLQQAIGLAFQPGNDGNGVNGNPAFALTGNSSSLVAKDASAINPRAIVFTAPAPAGRRPPFVAMGFTRGEQFVELIAADPSNNLALNFFLFKFELACSASPAGCNNFDLLTPAVESNFTGYSLYQDDDLANTMMDCKECHQPGGVQTTKILRLQEFKLPWGHFFSSNQAVGVVLLNDYFNAHSTSESYAGIPGTAIPNSDALILENAVTGLGFGNQPNPFDTNTILGEVQNLNPLQPNLNMPPGTSPTWSAIYQNAVDGKVIPPPYHDIKITDPDKLSAATAAYKSAMSGATPPEKMPDIRNVILDSALADLSFRPAPGLDGRGILTHMCTQCHNSRLDPSISRAHFLVDQLDSLSRAEKDKAIERLNLPKESIYHMPPSQFRELSPDEIATAVTELKK